MACEAGPSKQEPVAMIAGLLRRALARARRAGIPAERIVLDPGIGFFRRAVVPWDAVDCLVLDRLARLRQVGRPLLVRASRTSFSGKLTGRKDAADRLSGSLAAAAIAAYNGAALIRTHDVAATRDAVRVAEHIRASASR